MRAEELDKPVAPGDGAEGEWRDFCVSGESFVDEVHGLASVRPASESGITLVSERQAIAAEAQQKRGVGGFAALFRTVDLGDVRLLPLLGLLRSARPASPSARALCRYRRLVPAASAFVAAGKFHGRVPAVYPDSALHLFLVDLQQRRMSNLRGISGRIESESHPLRQKSRSPFQVSHEPQNR